MPNLTTPLCRMLGITAPILQAPVATSPDLAIAVSEAGGLGVLPISWTGTDALRWTLAEVRARTAMPFAVNIVIPLMEEAQQANLDLALEADVPVISTFYGDPPR